MDQPLALKLADSVLLQAFHYLNACLLDSKA